MNKTGNLGIGIHVMKQFMDRVLYERVGNSNHLTLVKKLK
jgi:anti-sigma regulatory factor (Ser/Thr protein kinase)